MEPERVTLYRAPTTECNVRGIGAWLTKRVDCTVSVRERFLDRGEIHTFAQAFARARVHSPYKPTTGSEMYGIRRYEERVIEDPTRAGGVLYDGVSIQRSMNAVLNDDERDLSHLHIVFLDRVIGTWGTHDGRWHKRIAVLGQPTLVSVPGLVEAPAKPESYYRVKHHAALLTGDAPPQEVIDAAIEEDVIVPNDPRTTEALKGYALAAFHLIATGDEFCSDEQCRLSNPHRHEGIIRAQLTDPEFCPTHERVYSQA